MLYEYQYTIGAIIVTVVLLIVSYQRRSISLDSNNIYFSLLYCNIITALMDLLTFHTISYPDRYSIEVLYGSNILYLILYCVETATFLRYIASLIGERKVTSITNQVYVCSIALQTSLLLSSPFTHWVIYFDENKAYHHGPFMWLIYIIPIGLAVTSVVLFTIKKSKFNQYQSATSIMLLIMVLVGFSVQRIVPRLDLSTFIFALVMCVIYMVFENPAYYTHLNTRCLNGRAFHKTAEEIVSSGKKMRVVFIEITNQPKDRGIHAAEEIEDLIELVAEMLSKEYHKNLFYIDSGRFVLLVDSLDLKYEEEIKKSIQKLFEEPVKVDHDSIQVELNMRSCGFHEMEISDDFIDHLVESISQNSVEELFGRDGITGTLTYQHNYRLIEDALADALDHDRFRMTYQPIYDIETGRFCSAEALLRLKDPQLGNISPDVCIPIAEKNGKVIDIGNFVFEDVCRFLSDGRAKSLGLQFVEINVSAIQLKNAGLAQHFIQVMDQYGIDPEMIKLEITESAELATDDTALYNIRTLKQKGVAFAVDDYGSGFATTGYLFKMPISIVKIDKSILWEAMKNPEAMIIFESTMKMVNELGKKIVVEGAEDENMVEMIVKNRGHYIQGYYFSKPVYEDEFIRYLEKNQKDQEKPESKPKENVIDISRHIC